MEKTPQVQDIQAVEPELTQKFASHQRAVGAMFEESVPDGAVAAKDEDCGFLGEGLPPSPFPRDLRSTVNNLRVKKRSLEDERGCEGTQLGRQGTRVKSLCFGECAHCHKTWQ